MKPLEMKIYKVKIPEYLVGEEVYLLKEEEAIQTAKCLTTLEIIKDKHLYWDLDYQPFKKENDYRAWDNELYQSVKLTKEEYELLKEVLK